MNGIKTLARKLQCNYKITSFQKNTMNDLEAMENKHKFIYAAVI